MPKVGTSVRDFRLGSTIPAKCTFPGKMRTALFSGHQIHAPGPGKMLSWPGSLLGLGVTLSDPTGAPPVTTVTLWLWRAAASLVIATATLEAVTPGPVVSVSETSDLQPRSSPEEAGQSAIAK